jgi:hypothetical protein
MKIRKGFVSNSSSSSYICDICGEQAVGYDISLSDYEMYQCVNGHIFCESHMKAIPVEYLLIKASLEENVTKWTEYYNQNNSQNYKHYMDDAIQELNDFNQLSEVEADDLDDYGDLLSELRYEYPAEFCPICRFDYLSKDDLYKYINIDDIKKEIVEKFDNYEDFKSHLNNK